MMRSGLAVLMMVSTMAMAGEIVPVPDDFGLLELPEAGLAELKKAVVLKAQSVREKIVLKTQRDGTQVTVLKCDLLYEPNSQRRTIPVGTRLVVTGTSIVPIVQDIPAVSCFKANHYPERPSQEHFVSLKSASGNFSGTLYCRQQVTWTAPGDVACDYSDEVVVGNLKDAIQFLGDKDKLSGTIGEF